MTGEAGPSPSKQDALSAFERGEEHAHVLLKQALSESPYDGALLVAHASACLRTGLDQPFARLERVLVQAPDWTEGHKALARLKNEARDPSPLSTLEAALKQLPKNPGLWMAYLTLLGSADRHLEAAKHAAQLRKTIADLPELRLVEARHRGFAGEVDIAQRLLAGLPEHLPELGFERARSAMRLGELERASDLLEAVLAQNANDIGAWALAELCWRKLGHPKHAWLCPTDTLFLQSDLGFDEGALAALADNLRALHVTGSAPLGQSVRGGTQTYGNLRLREDDTIRDQFERIDRALHEYTEQLPEVEVGHPLASLTNRAPEICASWSIRLEAGGRHVPHLHDGGRISSAAHIAVPSNLLPGEGVLELGLPPEDIPIELDPLAIFAPKPGHLVLFPSFVYHSTAQFGSGERLTVAFDAV